MNAATLVQQLGLIAHPEGGFYKETYRATGSIPQGALPEGFGGDRSFSTAIYYLLQQGDLSAFHRIRSDEGWHFYAGSPLLIHVIEEDGTYLCIKLGALTDQGTTFQYVVPARAWFASTPAPGTEFSLVGCTVAPGFDFQDFEMAERDKLIHLYPQHRGIIEQLTR